MRAKVTQVQGQKVESEKEVTGWEAEQLMRKYGYSTKQSSIPSAENKPSSKNSLTFEEMLKQEEEKEKKENERLRQKRYGPKPITFDSKNGYHSESKYGTDDDSGFGFKIDITTDMKMPD